MSDNNNDPFANIDFDAIGQAANRQEQSVTKPAVVEAVKEQEDLFQTEIRKKVLGVIKTVLDVVLILFCVILIVRTWHLINPPPNCLTWIDDKHLELIDNLLKSSLLVAVGGVFRDSIVSSLPTSKKKKTS